MKRFEDYLGDLRKRVTPPSLHVPAEAIQACQEIATYRWDESDNWHSFELNGLSWGCIPLPVIDKPVQKPPTKGELLKLWKKYRHVECCDSQNRVDIVV